MTTHSSLLQKDKHFRGLYLPQDNAEMTQCEILEKPRIAAREPKRFLKVLTEKDGLKVQSVCNSGFDNFDVLTPQKIVEKLLISCRFLRRKMAGCEALKAKTKALNPRVVTYIDPINLAK